MTWISSVVAVIFALSASCGGGFKPTTPTAPPARHVRVTVRSATSGDVITPVTATLVTDNPSLGQPGLQYRGENDPSGRVTFTLDAKVPVGAWGATLRVVTDDYDLSETRVALADDLADVLLTPTFHALPKLVPTAKVFRLSTGEHFTLLETSSFKLYKRYLDEGSESIRPVLQQLRDLGFNTVRVFGMAQNLWPFHPQDYGTRYYTELPAFATLLGQHGLYLEFTVFADTQLIMADSGMQQTHWLKVALAFADHPVLLELGNELNQHDNAVTDLALFSPPANVCASHGSNGADNVPPRPAWCYEVYHSNDLPEWWRKVGHNAMELADESGRPAFSNENTRAPDRLSSEAQASDAAAAAALLAAGSCYHSVSGRDSVLFTDAEQALARAWVSGARSVPLSCQDGPYSHRADLENATVLRAYQRGSDPACVVLIRR